MMPPPWHALKEHDIILEYSHKAEPECDLNTRDTLEKPKLQDII